jgi:hypothetical protein
MKLRRLVTAAILGLLIGGGTLAAHRSASAHAAIIHPCYVCLLPQLSINASHQFIAATGSNFYTNGQPVYLFAYGISGGSKHYLTYQAVTPSTTYAPNPCFVACVPGSFWTEFAQPNDSCGGGGYSSIEVDAWEVSTSGWYEAASATTTASCPAPPR